MTYLFPHSPRLLLGAALLMVSVAPHPAVSTQGVLASPSLLIQQVNVVDIDSAVIQRGRDVLISGGDIRQIGPAGTLPAPQGATVVQGADGFLIPGLMDMHAHLRGGALPGWVSTEWFMPLLLAHGITGVRDMTSDCDTPGPAIVCLDQMVEWGREVEAGERLGPRLLALSTARVSPPWDREITEDEARVFVERAANKVLSWSRSTRA